MQERNIRHDINEVRNAKIGPDCFRRKILRFATKISGQA